MGQARHTFADQRIDDLSELAPGALVLADDSVSLAAQMADYLGYVRDPGHGYVSIAFPESDGLEISCRT